MPARWKPIERCWRRSPADVSALLGLERSLLPLNRSAEFSPQCALPWSPPPQLGGVRHRSPSLGGGGAAGQRTTTAERWARIAPTEEAPYREWGAAELGRQNRAAARDAYLRGRERLGRPDAMAAEMAQLSLAEADYPTALREWLLAVRRLPGYRATAVSTLAQAPESSRPDLLRLLAAESDLVSRRIEADLRARWGDPAGRVPGPDGGPARPIGSRRSRCCAVCWISCGRCEASRARQTEGMVLEAIAARSPEAQASRLRLRRHRPTPPPATGPPPAGCWVAWPMTGRRPGAVAADAATTLIGVLISEGKLDDATERLAELRPDLAADDYDAMRRRIALGWMKQGNLARADSAIARRQQRRGARAEGPNPVVSGRHQRRGRAIQGGGPLRRRSGRGHTPHHLLALLRPMETDSLPGAGPGAAAAGAGRHRAGHRRTGAGGGRSAGPAWRGRAEPAGWTPAAATGKPEEAERLLRAAAVQGAPATAPAAELALADLFISGGRRADAQEMSWSTSF